MYVAPGDGSPKETSVHTDRRSGDNIQAIHAACGEGSPKEEGAHVAALGDGSPEEKTTHTVNNSDNSCTEHTACDRGASSHKTKISRPSLKFFMFAGTIASTALFFANLGVLIYTVIQQRRECKL